MEKLNRNSVTNVPLRFTQRLDEEVRRQELAARTHTARKPCHFNDS